ncbi:MAG: hypothetical protein ACJ762_04495 [Solirubrobacteraceae bacterium]
MAATTGRTDIGSRSVSARSPERLATETKAAPKTTEFFAFIAVVVGILIAAMLVKGGDSEGGTDAFIAKQAWLYVSIVTAAYLISRGLAKSGSREPYWGGGTNESRDRD